MRLVGDDGLAELHALLGVLEGLLEGGAGHADGGRGHAGAGEVEGLHDVPKPWPAGTSRFSLGTLTLSKMTSEVLEARMPILSSFLPMDTPS